MVQIRDILFLSVLKNCYEFAFGSSQVRVSVDLSVILVDIYHYFSQALEVNPVTLHR